MPKQNISDFTFDPAKPAIIESGFAGRTHIKIRALVNGEDVGWFILDSGAAAMVIDKTLLASLFWIMQSRFESLLPSHPPGSLTRPDEGHSGEK